MAKQTIGIGTAANDGTGDPARTAFGKVNDNFDELYSGLGGLITLAGGESSIVQNATDNTIDATVTYSANLGAGGASFPCHLGKDDALPIGSDLNPGWSTDTGYVAGAADASSIFGGYDEIVNSTGSAIFNSNHSMISYNSGGHSIIAGGSYNWVGPSAERSGIISARQSSIQGGAYNLIVGGDNSDITATMNYNAIIGGATSVISGATQFSAIVGTNTGAVSGDFSGLLAGSVNTITADYAAIAGGLSGTVSGNYSAVVGGTTNTVSGAYSVALAGSTNTCAEGYAVVAGQDSVALAPNSITLGCKKLVEVGDAQAITLVQAIRTTNATLTNMSANSEFIELQAGKWTAGTGTVLLVGMRDGSADGNNDGDYTQVAYTLTFAFFWDGTSTGFLCTTGTETTVNDSRTLNMVLMSQANHDFTAGAAPHVALGSSSGGAASMRIKVTGIAATKINWVARIDLVMTKVS